MIAFWISDFRFSIGRSDKKVFCLALCVLLFALYFSAEAQQSGKIPRIRYLTIASLSSNVDRIDAFRQGLRELGYVDGKNIAIEWRSGEGKAERQRELAAELVRLKVDVIVTSGRQMTRAVKDATSTIPIVMAQDSDPVGNGFVTSLARPGGNITGLSTLSSELSGKQVELLKEIVPKLSRMAVFGNSNEPGNAKILKEIELAAGRIGVQVQFLDIVSPKDVENIVRAATKLYADALLVLSSALFTDHRTEIANFALRNRVPAIYATSSWVDTGGLMSYAPNFLNYLVAPQPT